MNFIAFTSRLGRLQDPTDARVVSVTSAGAVLIGSHETFTGNVRELLKILSSFVQDGNRHLVVTPNVDQVLNLGKCTDFDAVFADADIRILDGAPLVALARILGARRAARNTGADLLVEVARAAGSLGWRVAILGGRAGVPTRAAANLRAQYCDVDVHGIDLPYLSGPEDPAAAPAVAALNALYPDIVFICLGSPKQELWYAYWRQELPRAVFVGAGAAADFVAAVRVRAPRLIQKMGIEWFWRLNQEPRRLAARYLIKGPKFILVILTSILKTRVRPSAPHRM